MMFSIDSQSPHLRASCDVLKDCGVALPTLRQASLYNLSSSASADSRALKKTLYFGGGVRHFIAYHLPRLFVIYVDIAYCHATVYHSLPFITNINLSPLTANIFILFR